MGNITEKDVLLAGETRGVIFGFEVDCQSKIVDLAKSMSVPIKLHRLLFKLSENLQGLENEVEILRGHTHRQDVVGKGMVKEVFKFRGRVGLSRFT